MRGYRSSSWRRGLVAMLLGAGVITGVAASAASSFAAQPTITGTVEDTSGNPLASVTVNVQDPSTDSTVASTTTGSDGTFSASVNSGTYNVEFVPPSSSNLQSYLATGVAAGSTPLTIILKAALVVQVQGTVTDTLGNAYTGNQGATVLFSSPLNSGNPVQVSGSGSYSVSLLADQNFTAAVNTYTPGNASNMEFDNLPVGALQQSQTYNFVLPTAELSVSLRDASGDPITGGTLAFDQSTISSLPGLPGASATTYSAAGAALNASGNTTVVVPDGITLTNPRIVLTSGLIVPFKAPAMNGNQSVTVTAPASIQVQGTVTDTLGNAYTGNQGATVLFSSPLNSGNPVQVSGSGSYSVSLLADQNFTAAVNTYTPGNASNMEFDNLPVGALQQSQTYNFVLPTAELSVSLRDASGDPITGGTLAFDQSTISSLPGLPGASATTYSAAGAALNASGNTTVVVPDGITLTNPRIVLTSGLIIPFKLPPITGELNAYIIFNETTGTVTVDDQPPVVTGSTDRAPNANGWYNAPVTITWTSVEPNGAAGTPTTPPPVTLSTEGANQTVTSAKSCDPAGNCATGTVAGLNIDMTPPTVSVTGVTSGTTYNQAPSPGCSTTDSLSGVAASATVSVTNSGTSYTATCSGATDNAGNSAAAVSVTYQVIPNGFTTATLTDSNGNPISGASVAFRSASGSVTNATTGSDGTAEATLTPGSYSVTMYYANGYQTKTITVTANGPNAVSFATVTVTAQINDPDSGDIAAASVAQAGNTGTYGPKTAVSSSGQVTFQVLPGTNTFAAYDAGGYQTQTVTVSGTMTVTFATVTVTAQINDPDSADLTAASVTHAGNTGTYGPKTAVNSSGQVTFQVLPGTNTFTVYDAGGYETQTITVTGPATVTFATVAVTVTVDKSGSPLTTAEVTHAGNIGTYGPKTPVDGNGQVIFQVLPGTNSFTAYDGSAYASETITVTTATPTTISVS
jgi:Carboxypeptidase regulatory-like domain/Bacterial Ig-like domain (group 1)